MTNGIMDEKYLDIDGLQNARDIGGMKTKDNRIIKRKKFIRSACLDSISDKGIRTLKNDYHLGRIYDLRSLAELEELPDKKIDGIQYIHLEVLKADMSNPNVPLDSKGFRVPYSTDMMFKNYQEYAVGKDAIKCYRQFFNDLVNDDVCILFHCRSGKDRTGILALLIEYILGVDIEDIHNDYLLINKLKKNEIDSYVKKAEEITKNPYRLSLMRMAGGTSLELLNQFYLAINNEYGDMDNYLLKALDIDKDKRNLLKDKYTENI